MRRATKTTIPIPAVSRLAIGAAAVGLFTTACTGDGIRDPGALADLKVIPTSTVTALGPGMRPQPLSGVFNNPNDHPVYVTEMSAVVTQVNDATGNPAVGCDASDFSIAGTGAVNAHVPPGTGVGRWGNLSIVFNNKPDTNQDACQDTQLVISYTAT